MKGKIKKTMTCEWIKSEPVEGQVCQANTEEAFLDIDNLISVFEFKANLLLQRTGMELSGKLMSGEMKPIDAWNSS